MIFFTLSISDSTCVPFPYSFEISRDFPVPLRHQSGRLIYFSTINFLINSNDVIFLWMLVFSPQDGGSMFLQNVRIYLQVHTASKHIRPSSTFNGCEYLKWWVG
jgi:hypothetical protein